MALPKGPTLRSARLRAVALFVATTLAAVACTVKSDVDVKRADQIDEAGDGGVLPAPKGPTSVTAGGTEPDDDWSLPQSAMPLDTNGFFSEQADTEQDITTHVLDVSWAQIKPTKTSFSATATGEAQGMSLSSLASQRAKPGAYWSRLWVTGTTWAPSWVKSECNVQAIPGKDNDGQEHLPIWNDCVWSNALAAFKELYIDNGLAADPNLKFVYVPGGFAWCEFDYDMIVKAANAGQLTFEQYHAWYKKMVSDLVSLFGANAKKLIFTGEDYPFQAFGGKADLLAHDAVAGGMGIRTGITEVSNFHLSQAPAYGVTMDSSGHMVVDETWPTVTGARIAATENECYNACGFKTSNPYYAVKQSNLKALQLRVGWLYVVPGDSYMSEYKSHYAWVRNELGRTRKNAIDAWVSLREAEDTFLEQSSIADFEGKPYVKNLERWLVQRDVLPDGNSGRGSEVHKGELDASNGTAYEGRVTKPALGQHALYIDVDDVIARRTQNFEVKVTFKRKTAGSLTLEVSSVGGLNTSEPVALFGDGATATATFSLQNVVFDGSLPGKTDFALRDDGKNPIEVSFVRLILN
jgi:hypothetical protein